MNLNISYNWLKEYVKLTDSAHDFAKKISLSGPSVDHITEIKPNFDKVVVGKIIKIEQHPNADKLHVCQVKVGDKQPLNIVCGAPNIAEGQKVPVVLVGGRVGDMEVKAAKLRGIDSEGMLCSQRELGIGDDHTGIYILPDYVEVGLPLEKVMPISDTILDMEVTSNRPDAMCVIGIAREAAAILDAKFLYKDPKPNLSVQGENKKLAVTVKEPKLCPRYDAAVMTDVKVESSPLWMQQRLLAAGLRPINNLVDITNYILLEFGQPMHVFDYNKLAGHEIIVRLAKKGEKILALDGKEYELSTEQLAIADGENPCAVAGVMGGESSAATAQTKTIVLEAANFNPVSIRHTARALNLHSEASNLYEKGLQPEGVHPALLRAIELVKELAGGKMANDIIDVNNYKFKAKTIKLNSDNVTRILGVKIKTEKIKSILESLGFKVSAKTKSSLEVTAPWWRDNDLEGEHDLIEEVARIYGYQNLPTQLMPGELPVDFSAGNKFQQEDKVKDLLVGFGLTEIFSYSFISEKIIKDAGFDPIDAVRIANPLSLDFEYMRTSLIPGLLQIISENAGFYNSIKIFDLSKIYLKHEGDLPEETMALAIACVSASADEALADLRGIWEGLTIKLGLNYEFGNFKKKEAYWSDNSQAMKGGKSEEIIGGIGLISKDVAARFSIKKSVAVAYVDFAALLAAARLAPSYATICKYPGIELDISMEISEDVSFGQVKETAAKIDQEMIKNISYLSVFKGQGIASGKKALAIRVTYRHDDKTLTLPEVQAVHNKVVDALKKEYNINIR